AGFALATMSIGWALASIISGRIISRLGYRNTSLLGAGILLSGTLGIAFGERFGATGIALAVGATGMGMGFMNNALLITIQEAVAWGQRGAATALYLFLRMMGGTIGVAALGSLLNATIRSNLTGSPAWRLIHDTQIIDTFNRLLSPAGRVTLTQPLREALSSSLASGMHAVFIATVGLAGACLLLLCFLPAQVPAQRTPAA
ncbi:MAG: hypothetical protein HY692_03690, partial [Cyanobacteria bacterium NC_groundwater_1444_Ag_S-0.65um_54_12]|nr:hypothetical protein [Cyanobacteria bacterium NC_groundwater_1444_Ag_S-0.65um_54_12]